MPPIADLEFGRGRQHDSSSSRESSPQPKRQKRSFSPGSDDGDTEMPPMADDDTPPPPERPIIRQAVAFGGEIATPSTINIYQAKFPQQVSSNIQFLPGQAPASAAAAKQKSGRKKKRNDEYKAQSGRFRLETYDPTPTAVPALSQGQGPYASLFRGISEQSSRSGSPATTLASDASSSRTVSRKSDAAKSGRQKAASSSKNTSAVQPSPVQPMAIPNAVPIVPMSTASVPMQFPTQYTSPPARGSYYRQDYGAGRMAGPAEGSLASSVAPMPDSARQASLTPEATNPSANTSHQNTVATVNGTKKVTRHGLRMVTILAQDIRSGEIDHQLIEVKIPLRPAENPKQGWWADAKELIEQWQKSPARVDGPARVYTLRGKYRQILLRVDTQNQDDYAPMNVVINSDRTIDVVIENLPTVGVPPPAPQIPRDLLSPPPDSDHEPEPEPEFIEVEELWEARASPAQARPAEGRKRRASPSCEDGRRASEGHHRQFRSDPPNPRSPPPASSSTMRTSRTASPVTTATAPPERSDRSYNKEHIHLPVTRPKVDNRGYESPQSDDEPDVINKAILGAVDTLLQKDKDWKLFFRMKGRQPTAPNMIAQYQFVRNMMDRYVGQAAPFRSKRDFVIEEKHIVGALHIEDEDGRYVSNCKETLGLLKLYGKGGSRSENPDVLRLQEDTSQPAYNAKPIKRLLHLLRDVDAKWKSEHSI